MQALFIVEFNTEKVTQAMTVTVTLEVKSSVLIDDDKKKTSLSRKMEKTCLLIEYFY